MAAGLHVYMAKPVAVDAPGCLRIEAAGKQATQRQRVFLVDYQIPTDPGNIEVVRRIHAQELGKVLKITTRCVCGGLGDPPKTANLESLLRNETWCNDVALGGGYILAEDIHAIDVGVWIAGGRPVVAMGSSRIGRVDPHGDSPDVASITFEYADGLIHEHSEQALDTGAGDEYACIVCGQTGHAMVTYYGRAQFQLRRKRPVVDAPVVNLYEAGARRNITAFHQAIALGQFENATVKRAVDSYLTGILGREAALRRGLLTMEELLKENKRIEVDISGLKA